MIKYVHILIPQSVYRAGLRDYKPTQTSECFNASSVSPFRCPWERHWSLTCFFSTAAQWRLSGFENIFSSSKTQISPDPHLILRMNQLAFTFVCECERERTFTLDKTNLCRNPNKIVLTKPFTWSIARKVRKERVSEGGGCRGWIKKYLTVPNIFMLDFQRFIYRKKNFCSF